MDLVGLTSKDVFCVCDGKVTMARYYGEYGNAVKVKDSTTGKIFLFAHLASISVKKGQKVTRSTKIGVMGGTGRVKGDHLHIEMRTSSDKYGVVENIASYMKIPNRVGTYNSSDYQLKNNISYQVHIQDIGWQNPKKNWEIAGTIGESKRIEALVIHSDIPIKYRGHVESKGWSDWVNNGEIVGTTGKGLRLEAVEIMSPKHLKGRAHVQSQGWLPEVVGSPIILGTSGKSLRLEALRIEFI